MSEKPLLEVRDLVRTYTLPREKLFAPPPTVEALRGVSFALHAGKSLGVVGESGSGKSTLARLVMALDTPSAGQVLLNGSPRRSAAFASLASYVQQKDVLVPSATVRQAAAAAAGVVAARAGSGCGS